MSEREPTPALEPNAQDIAKALCSRRATIRDVAYGEGYQFSAGRGALRLEVYPRSLVTRVTGQDVRIELFGSAAVRVSDSGVEFCREHPGQEASLTVLSDAGVVFTFIGGGQCTPDPSPEPAGGPQPREDHSSAPSPLLTADSTPPVDARSVEDDAHVTHHTQPTTAPVLRPAASLPVGTPDASETPVVSMTDSTDTPGEAVTEHTPRTERGTLVKFTGRLGKDPFVTDKQGSPRVRLSVGEHYEDEDGHEQTRWHEVWATSANSEAVRRLAEEGTLRQGVEVRIRGYQHEREADKQGRPQRPFVRAFRIDLPKQAAPRRSAPRSAPGTPSGGER